MFLAFALKERQTLHTSGRSHSTAPSELGFFIYTDPGFRCAPPWAKFSGPFGAALGCYILLC